MTGADAQTTIQVGDWTFRPDLDELRCNAEVVKLEPRTSRLLQLLCSRPGEVVSVNAMLDAVWPGVVVTPSSVYQAIAQLRRALRDPDPPAYVATLPKRGYRLIARVAPNGAAPIVTAANPRVASWRLRAAVAVGIGVALLAGYVGAIRSRTPRPAELPAYSSLAVLPFSNLSGEPRDEYLANGLADDLIDKLTNISDLRIIARTSSSQFRSATDLRVVGQALSVPAVITGTMRRNGERLHIVASLFDVKSGRQRWSRTFERRERDLIAVDDEIADAVLQALDAGQPRAKPRRPLHPANNSAAYRALLLGRFWADSRTAESLAAAQREFQNAVRLQPDYALAFSQLADSYSLQVQYANLPAAQMLPLARAAAEHSLQIDPLLAQGHASLGLIENIAGRYEQAGIHLRRAIALDPDDIQAQMWYGRSLFLREQFEPAYQAFVTALARDPLSPMLNLNIALTLADLDRISAARPFAERAVNLAPDLPNARWALGYQQAAAGELRESVANYEQALAFGLLDADAFGELAGIQLLLGEFAQSDAMLARAETIAPLSPLIVAARIDWLARQGRAAAAAAFAANALARRPQDPKLRALDAYARLVADDVRGSAERYRDLANSTAGSALMLDRQLLGGSFSHAVWFALAARANHTGEWADMVLQRAEQSVNASLAAGSDSAGLLYVKACHEALHNDQSAAVATLQKSIRAGWRDYVRMRDSREFANLRDNVQFRALLANGLQRSPAKPE